ncbi:excalibur calcium-binding domain-containing protein [Sphingomonas sp. PB2P12]|uniref:excalibur calcium-binding domain-containing protein n=1 Tax=Sphingomonas sandaracina TaxID=3096157 RepID=UPI002FCA9657
MDRSFIAITATASALMFAGVWSATAPTGTPLPEAPPPSLDLASPVDAASLPVSAKASKAGEPPRVKIAAPVRDAAPYNVTRSVYGQTASPVVRSAPANAVYRGCREARAAGVTPLYRGTPGYGAHMDGDGDGVACEAYRR